MAHPYAPAAATGAARVCRCFRLTRRDGAVFGFTDHDQPVSFDGTAFEPSAALTASETAAKLGLAPDELDASGALSSAAITEADIAAGRYDGTTVEAWDVDWSAPADRVLLGVFTLGQIERGPAAFTAELRSRSAALDVKQGRIMATLCDVKRLGDARCGLSLAGWTAAGTVLSATGTRLVISGPSAGSGHWDRGTLDFTSGANAGAAADIRSSRRSGSDTVVDLWREPSGPVAVGDGVALTAGCDRSADMCRNRFGNLLNFRGFPFLPGEATVSEYALPGDPDLDGGSRFD